MKAPAMKGVEWVPIASLREYPANAKRHPPEQVKAIARSISEFGFLVPILVDADREILGGHGRLLAARDELGMAEVPILQADHLSPEQAKAFRVADNRLSELGAWDRDTLRIELGDLHEGGFDIGVTGFDLTDFGAIRLPDPGADETPEAPESPVTVPGDLWLLGDGDRVHRLLCADATDPDAVVALMDSSFPDLLLTDPPYCSGGFQETEKSKGSVGTDAVHKQIANDRISTRGYIKLLKRVISLGCADFLYCFTDWRMWVHLFDVVESCGHGVRSMVVWDKGTPGMGRGWRAQHELVMWASRSVPPFDVHEGGAGNVVQAKRTGNTSHTTQKPVDLLEALIQRLPFARTVYDPFVGSGSTILAAERQGRRSYSMELDPVYCDVTVRRWEEYTGSKAERVEGHYRGAVAWRA